MTKIIDNFIINCLPILYLKDYIGENEISVITMLNRNLYQNIVGGGIIFYQMINENYLDQYQRIFKLFSIKVEKRKDWWNIFSNNNNDINNNESIKSIKLNYHILSDRLNFLQQCKFNLSRYLENNEIYINIVRGDKSITTFDRIICFSIIYAQDQILFFLLNIIISTLQQIQLQSHSNKTINNNNNNNNNKLSTTISTFNQNIINNNNQIYLHFNQQSPNLKQFIKWNQCLVFDVPFDGSSSSGGSGGSNGSGGGLSLKIYPIYFAIIKGNSQFVKFLLQVLPSIYFLQGQDSKLPITNRSPLYYSTTREMTLLLLQLGCNIHDVDYKGMLPIHYHSLNGHIDVVKCLIDDSTINAQDSNLNTPLHLSSLSGNLPLIKILLSSGARLSVENSQKRYPIHNTCINGSTDLIKYFIELYSKMSSSKVIGGSTNSSSNNSSSSGLRTSNGGNQVSIQIPDKENNTPIDLLVLNNHFLNAIELLKYEGYIVNKEEFNFKEARKIGAGAFGDVFLLEWRNKNVAVKRVKIDKILESGKSYTWIRDKFILEAVLMVKLSSFSSFVKLYATCIEEKELLLVLEFCDNGSLFNILNSIGNDTIIQSLPSINTLALNIANGMNYLHSLSPQIIHRDLTCQNILISSTFHAKIADFGISRFKGDIGDKTMTSIGNPRFRSPEVTKGQKYSEKVDVFGFGMILYELFTRRVPFHEYEQVAASFKIANGERPSLPMTIDHRWSNLIQMCWHQNPHSRPSFDQILKIISNLPISNIPKVLNPLVIGVGVGCNSNGNQQQQQQINNTLQSAAILNNDQQQQLSNSNNAVTAKLSLSTSGGLFSAVDSDYTVGTCSASYDVGYDNDGDMNEYSSDNMDYNYDDGL